ncbi:MAG: GxxExxY protein [Aestuariibaculum sp.]
MISQQSPTSQFKTIEDVHLAQTMNYVEAYNLDIGLLINFGSKSLPVKRIYNVNHPDNKKKNEILKSNHPKNQNSDK